MASAVSSIVGFTILGFAPMPLFSSFGFLTAIMIFLALAASLAPRYRIPLAILCY